jgi:prophage tail gpP-like protein
MDDELILMVGTSSISGWQAVRVTRGIERCPSDFEIALTQRAPNGQIIVKPGDPCLVSLGGDVVITGYVDGHEASFGATQHDLRITGRGKCQDLVDCAAEWKGGQTTGATALEIARKLAEPHAIQVDAAAPEQDNLPLIPRINLILGETAFEIIERVCRFRGLLAYETSDGNLLLAQAGTSKASGGFEEGKNIEAATLSLSMASRFREYRALLQSMDRVGELGGIGNLQYVAYDTGVRPNRKMVIIAEYGDSGAQVCKQRALWEAARRLGRASHITLTTDSWRDTAGKLWEPNTLVPILLPSLDLPDATWLITEVTYRRDEAGTHADLTIMPPAAFLPQPVLLIPGINELAQDPQQPAATGVTQP